MKILAEKQVIEMSENNIVTTRTAFIVNPGETVEALLQRVGLTGHTSWHYDQASVVIKLIKEKEL